MDETVGNNPVSKYCCCTADLGAPTSTSRPATVTFRGGHRVLLLRPIGLWPERPARRAIAVELDRFVDEVEQVRSALGLEQDNFVLYGQSWGGILAMEYALRYQQHLRGLVISNMMSSAPAYNAYAQEVLMPEMDQAALAEIQSLEASGNTEGARYMELLNEQHYVHHVLRMPVADWPDPVQRAFAHINPVIYVSMQGPSELGISGVPSSPTGSAPTSCSRSKCRPS